MSCLSFLPLFPQTIHLLSTCPNKRKTWPPHSSTLANATSSRDALEISSSQTLNHQLSCYQSLISPSLQTQLCLQMLPCSKISYPWSCIFATHSLIFQAFSIISLYNLHLLLHIHSLFTGSIMTCNLC